MKVLHAISARSHALPQILSEQGIRYILLARAADWRVYDYVLHAPGLRVIDSWTDLTLILNTAWSPRSGRQ